MYEYGLRLGSEVSGLKGIQRQAKCYLACLNALRLGDPEYAWIVKPVTVLTTPAVDKLEVSKQTTLGKRLNMKVRIIWNVVLFF